MLVLHINDFYKRLKNKELFFDIIKDEIVRNPSIAKYGVPKELKKDFGHFEDIFKYNL